MTNNEAIGFLQSRVDLIDKYYSDVKDYRETLVVAIKALEQKPCDDCVSRESMMVRVKEYFDNPSYDEKMLFDDLVNLPSVTPQPITLEKAIDYLNEIGWMQEHDKEMAQPKIGRWIHPYKSDIACECSECHIQMPITKSFNYCPNCGCRMVEPQESEG